MLYYLVLFLKYLNWIGTFTEKYINQIKSLKTNEFSQLNELKQNVRFKHLIFK